MRIGIGFVLALAGSIALAAQQPAAQPPQGPTFKAGTQVVSLFVTVQDGPETVSQPLQPPKLEPEAGLAVRVVRVPLS